MSLRRSLYCLAILSLGSITAIAAEPFRFPEGRYGKGELRYINGVPVLTAVGTPEEIGGQIGALAVKPSLPLVAHFDEFLKKKGLDKISPVIFAASEALYQRFPKRYRSELEAMVKASGADRNLVVLGNTAFDLEQLLLGCSGLIVSPDRSATGGTLYGRNCDFPFTDMIEEYSLVIVYRPTGRKAFAMVTFPGVLASNCGMNEDGLTLGANTARKSADGAPSFNPAGLPYSVAARGDGDLRLGRRLRPLDPRPLAHRPRASPGLRPEATRRLRTDDHTPRSAQAGGRPGLLHESLPACPDGISQPEVPALRNARHQPQHQATRRRRRRPTAARREPGEPHDPDDGFRAGQAGFAPEHRLRSHVGQAASPIGSEAALTAPCRFGCPPLKPALNFS